MSPSKREREYARRRYEKRAAKQAQAARLRRERRIVASIAVAVLLLTSGALIFLNSRTTPDVAATEPSVSAPATPSDALPTTNPQTYEAPPPASDSLGKQWTLTLTTNRGDIVLNLDGAAAPQAVASFVMLASNGFYDGTACHRLTGTFLQCGDPSASGSGGPGYTFGPIENAPTDDIYPAGTVAMGRQSGLADSMGSQFFLVFADTTLPSDSAGGYTVFGTVTSGLDILSQIGTAGTADAGPDGRPSENVIIENVEVL